jgi:hypothetical protein
VAQTQVDEPRTRGNLRWWREILYVIAFYALYSLVRNTTAAGGPTIAFHHAQGVIRVERLLGLYHERAIQHAFVGHRLFIRFWDIYYGTFHFIVTTAALVWCFRRRPDRYPRWRNTLACTTALALIGFAFFPLMPPRLLPTHYGFVDTLAKIGGLWSFDSGAMKAVSNQYAAMPSMHFGWSSWCAFVLWPAAGDRRWAKALLVAYPFLTLFAIIVTANHFWLDAAGGAATLAVGYVLGSALAARSRAASSPAQPSSA